LSLKKEKFEVLKKEMASYKEISYLMEREVDEMMDKFKIARHNYEILRREQNKADLALDQFEVHLKEVEAERAKDHRDVGKIRDLLVEMKNDVSNFENIRTKVFSQIPQSS